LESDIAGLCIGQPVATRAVQTVLTHYRRALMLASGKATNSAWAAFVSAADELRTIVAASVPANARTALTLRGLRVLDAILRENGDLRRPYRIHDDARRFWNSKLR
jgi:hypothetical protein